VNRSRRHAGVGTLVLGVAAGAWLAGKPAGAWDRISIVAAYLCLALLCLALLEGSRRAVVAGRGTLNSYRRRDVGIWGALTGLVHLLIATKLSMTPGYLDTIVNDPEQALRTQLFGWGSIVGFLVGLNLVVLLALSNDWSLRMLGPTWWKRLQRSSYVAFILTVGHGLAFQVLEARTWSLVGLLAGAAALVAVVQGRGIIAVRARLDR